MWFVIAFVVGGIVGALIVYVRLERLEREMGRLRLEHLFENHVARRHLDYVIVRPLSVFKGGVYVAPHREPIEAIIDGRRYKEGERLSEHLVVRWITDEGAMTTLSPEVRLEPPPEFDVRIGDHVFHNASLIDEWSVTIGVVPEHPRYNEWGLESLTFRLVTNHAVNEDGADASLSNYSAHFVGDGSPTTLPWAKQEWMPDQGDDSDSGELAFPGEDAVIWLGEGIDVYVASSKQSCDSMEQLQRSGGEEDLRGMVASGDAWLVPSGTRCNVVNLGPRCEARLLDGEHEGRTCFVPWRSVRRNVWGRPV